MALTEKLGEELARGGMIPPNQTGFKKGMGTIDNIYMLNYLINRQLDRKVALDRIVALFVDLKAAFDSLDRGILIKAMRERGIRKGRIERVVKVLSETRSRVKIGVGE